MDSSEIAEDFKDALLDLKVNSKPEIDTLTVIAKENTAHAQAISQVLENHIKTTRPEWMLPALYVLDSLIRHVGPPYSTYLGANLFRTFMEMYRQVNNAVRKDMEAVLRTWKEPPHGSTTTRPVMPVEVTEPIENALAKFKMVMMQSQQPRHMPGHPPFRNSPQPGMMYHNGVGVRGTPPPVDVATLIAQLQQPRSATPTFANTNPTAAFGIPASSSPAVNPALLAQAFPISTPQNNTPTNFAPFTTPSLPHGHPQPTISQEQLKFEVNQLLQSANVQKMFDATNRDLSQLVNTLESLKSLLDVKQFRDIDLRAMQGELSKISARLNSQIASLLNNPQGSTPTPVSFVTQVPVNPYPVVSSPPNVMQNLPPPMSFPQLQPQFQISTPPVASTPPVDVASLLSLLGPQSATSQPISTPLEANIPLPPNRSKPQSAAPPPSGDNGSLLDMLRANGLLGATPTPQPAGAAPAAGMPVSVPSSGKGRRYGVPLTQESITKTRRTHLIAALYSDIPDQCRQCGRRFPSTEAGKKQKMDHLDWHFKVNSRVANAAQSSIVHRSAYLDEIQWTRLRETQDGNEFAEDVASNKTKSTSNTNDEENEVYVLPPQDATKLNEPCSICMEPFKSVWHLKTQQPVWMDTIKVGNKYYHASCYGEATGGSNKLAVRNGAKVSNHSTPEPILGKRKFANAAA